MRFSQNWQDYELLDSCNGERLERWGEYILIRPDPQVIWKSSNNHPLWEKADAHYHRSKTGGGNWEILTKIPPRWSIKYQDLTFNIKTMGFKHTGIFPEQAVNWELLKRTISSSNRQLKVLNLFGYTGAATLACLSENAHVVHVDASKGMVAWGKENAISSGLEGRSVRWIVDDCVKFVKREIRRGNKYDIIIMDPPSYGRGPNGEIWKLEDEIYNFVELCSNLLYENSSLMLINSYTTGLSPSVMQYILNTVVVKSIGGYTSSDEIGLKVSNSNLLLPCGATAIWSRTHELY